ncbi:MAG: hypothetical protein RMK01_05130 [Thermomicrobium sp.]|nr:hypothetical protein [Thermomicrobium sp.]
MERRWRILVVDEDRHFQLALASALEDWATVRIADTLETARRLIDAWEPHAVILDPVLRTGDGLDLLRLCAGKRNLSVFCSLPQRFLASLRLPAYGIRGIPRNSSVRAIVEQITGHLAQGTRETDDCPVERREPAGTLVSRPLQR